MPGGGEWSGRDRDVFEALRRESPNLWRDGLDPRISRLKATPLMVGGVLYLCTPLSQGVAIDAATGRTLWIYNPKSYETGTPTMNGYWNHRGLAYWTDGEEERVLWGTGDYYLICVDAKTGRPVEGFGDHGRVDLADGLPRAERSRRDYLNQLPISSASPPIVVRGVVIVGSSIHDRRINKESPPGWVRAYDVRTGEHRWDFHTVPLEGEFGVETWENESWRYSGNTNVWAPMSADEELGYVYLPTGTGTGDYYGGDRLGDNLFAESLVCVDVETGRRVWHFQMVHHGMWDYDNPCAPNLVDITVDGRRIKAVAQVTKQGFCYVFDRETGEPIWPIEERGVPAATMPGEVASATQPHPTRPAPFEPQGLTLDDLIDFTPELRAEAVEIVKGFKIGPLFTPPSLPVQGGTQGTIHRPSIGGGANWPGAGIDPETGILYVPSTSATTVLHYYTPDPAEGGTLRYTHSMRSRAGPRLQSGLPIIKPPYSRMTAIDLNTGEHVWMVPNGDGDRVRNHPLLKDLDLPPLGGDGRGGPLVTKTLLVSALTAGGTRNGPRLIARDKATGEEVGSVDLPRRAVGTPMTYMAEGRQYIALTVAGSPPRLVALALP